MQFPRRDANCRYTLAYTIAGEYVNMGPSGPGIPAQEVKRGFGGAEVTEGGKSQWRNFSLPNIRYFIDGLKYS